MKGRKGVSPIVATLLLILVAVAAAVVLYAWVSGLSSTAKSSGAERASIAFTIEAATINVTDNGNITFYIRNIGSMPIEKGNWSVYVLDPTTSEVIAFNIWQCEKTISPGELIHGSVEVDSEVLENGQYYIVKLVSPQGVSDSIYVKATK